MKKVVRFLLAAFLALAVPLQGALAVTAAQCMAFGHHKSSAAQQSHANIGQAHDHAANSHSSTAQTDEGTGGGGHCGPCTACCASASIAGAAGLSIPSPASNAPY